MSGNDAEYINNRAETEEAIDEKGWLCTGDIVKFDEEGYLFIVDRLKEMIKYKGYQVHYDTQKNKK